MRTGMHAITFFFLLFAFAGLQLTAADSSRNTELEQAYRKEFAFLEAEKKVLLKRIEELDRETARKVVAAEQEISALQDKLLALTAQAERLAELLYEAERRETARTDSLDRLDTTLAQAGALLEKFDIRIPERSPEGTGTVVEQLDFAFLKAADILAEMATVRRSTGEFFLEDGTKVSGELIRVGNIATYGVSERGAGALAPAGDGKLSLWPAPTDAVARALLAGTKPDPISLFIYESADKRVEQEKKKSILEYTTSGGTLAWVIVFVGVVALLLSIVRAIFLRRSSTSTALLLKQLEDMVQTGKIEEALALCKKTPGATSRVIAAALRNIEKEREHLEDIISEAILHENNYLDRFGQVILVLAAVAPLLGLLGTVTGMIETFDVITEYGNSDPKMLSSGISVALITTQYGLYVAIPTLFIGNLLNGWAERIKDDMEQAALRVTNLFQTTMRKG